MRAAFDALRALAPAVQLTPGNEPSPGFAAHLADSRTPVRTHHGFSLTERAPQVWADDGQLSVTSDSVHPPRLGTPAAAHFDAWVATQPTLPVLETMYPGYRLGSDAELRHALRQGWPLALDVSHVFILREQGGLAYDTLRRLLDAPSVVEVHVSANDGRRDAHQACTRATFGLDYARERLRAGTPVVLECYLHRLSDDARRRQVDLLEEAA